MHWKPIWLLNPLVCVPAKLTLPVCFGSDGAFGWAIKHKSVCQKLHLEEASVTTFPHDVDNLQTQAVHSFCCMAHGMPDGDRSLHRQPRLSADATFGFHNVTAALNIWPALDNFKCTRWFQQHRAASAARICCRCGLYQRRLGGCGLPFYSLATRSVYRQGLLEQLAAVTITSGMRRDSCEGKAREAFPTPKQPPVVLNEVKETRTWKTVKTAIFLFVSCALTMF